MTSAVALTILLASCGGGGDSSSSNNDGSGDGDYKEPTAAATESITVEASNYSFEPRELTASSGITSIELEGKDQIHDFVFDDEKYPGFELYVSGNGAIDTKKIALKPGTYTFYCTVAGHRQEGMEGTLTVTSG